MRLLLSDKNYSTGSAPAIRMALISSRSAAKEVNVLSILLQTQSPSMGSDREIKRHYRIICCNLMVSSSSFCALAHLTYCSPWKEYQPFTKLFFVDDWQCYTTIASVWSVFLLLCPCCNLPWCPALKANPFVRYFHESEKCLSSFPDTTTPTEEVCSV